MITALFLGVAFFACVIGKICGMGGGVIIKPVLDAFEICSVATINFLSGCTVIGMSCWSVAKSFVKKESVIDLKVSTPLAVGAAAGGLLGKELFSALAGTLPEPERAGGVQALLLLVLTLLTLLYTLKKQHIRSHHVRGFPVCALIGLLLGALGAFLGIGGGPFNMAVLFFFFSMPTKTAAQNSLYIILISQTVSLLKTLTGGDIPAVALPLLIGMIVCGVLGSEAGGRINEKIDDGKATGLFEAAMILVMVISVYNLRTLL